MYFFCKPKYNDPIKRKHTVNKSFVSIFTFTFKNGEFFIFRALKKTKKQKNKKTPRPEFSRF